VHVKSVVEAIAMVLEKSDQLPRFDIYVISPDSSTSHREIFELATRLYFEEIKNPVFIPKWLSETCVYVWDWLGRLAGIRPLVRPWMMKYIDRKLRTESDHTRKALGWKISQGMDILERIPFLIENYRSASLQWHQVNKIALEKTNLETPRLSVAGSIKRMPRETAKTILAYIRLPDTLRKFKHYH
jgi:hypothetical protein